MKKTILLFSVLAVFFAQVVSAQYWSTSGNSIGSGNFIGSTNYFPLIFKVSGIYSGIIDPSNAVTYFGYSTGVYNTGKYNTGMGAYSQYSNTTGLSNTSVGYQTLLLNTTGGWNVALGSQALNLNTTGASNIAIGSGALYSNSTSSGNLAIGTNAAFNTTSGSVIALGNGAAQSNVNGTGAVVLGHGALYTAPYASICVSIGDSTLYNYNQTSNGGANDAIGYKSMYSTVNGWANLGAGTYSLYQNTSGCMNVALGPQALFRNTTGFENTGLGYSALYPQEGGGGTTTGSYNTGVGSQTLITNQTGNYNTGLGWMADVSASDLENATAIGAGAVVNASNKIRLGNSSVTVIEGNASYTVSDKRFKKNIADSVVGLTFIKKLRPVLYNLEAKQFDEFTMQQLPAAKREKLLKGANYTEAEKIRRSGFLAQEVEAAAKEVHYDFDGVHAPKNEQDNYSLSYSAFVVPLVKSVQELSSTNDSLRSKIDSLQAQVSAILTELNRLKAAKSVADVPQLLQNAPNPFNGSTVINYYLPADAGNAQLVITDAGGRVLKDVVLSGHGEGQAVIHAGELASGTYFYSLVVNDRRVATKTMVLVK